MFSKLSTFVSEVRVEFGKVSWPSRESLINSTNVVLLFSVGFAIVVGLFDLVVSFLRSVLLG